MFSEKDLAQIKKRGSSLAAVKIQIENFEKGFPFLNIVKAGTVGDGIIRLSEEEMTSHIKKYESLLSDKKVIKFVPASGAASRMFKSLFSFLHDFQTAPATVSLASNEPLRTFFERLGDFAFVDDLKKALPEGQDLNELVNNGNYDVILDHLLNEVGLGYGSLPKGLLKFHRYGQETRTPVEEHVVEGANSCTVPGGTVYLHLTVSPDHRDRFEAHIAAIQPKFESESGIYLNVDFSEQKPATDTIAVDLDNQPFRNPDGSLLFRPGGHGALIENLNEIDADLIFIKNIDNVVPDHLKSETYRYKKALAGVLFSMQEKIFHYLKQLETPSDTLIAEVADFLQNTLCILPPEGYGSWSSDDQLVYIRQKLDRPIRICGMVKNEGEPGGGPYWAKNPDGTVSLQIAESAQIDTYQPDQLELMQNATHFNPVDLICGTRNHEGKPFDLLKFRDPQTGFISSKSKDGKELKAQELPGLWNGAMSDWNTLFVEVPVITFNPVKTVNDLLRPQHQEG